MTVPLDTCLHGDALDMLRTLPDECAQTCVTSPPYWGLRDYGTATWEGGAEDCEHEGESMRTAPPGTDKQARNAGAAAVRSGDCRLCGARRVDSQLGLEPTPDEYVARMVAVFAEVRRVLRADGTLWLNLGDSYAHNGPSGGGSPDGPRKARETDAAKQREMGYRVPPGLKPKDLVGIPWRVAFALQADGWYLRQDIIWAKPSPMPESVTDRCTKAHEYVFLLSKSARYYYDKEAIAENSATGDFRKPYAEGQVDGRGNGHDRDGGAQRTTDADPSARNRRSVWTVATTPYPEAHFATFPPALIEPCILAGAPTGGVVLDPFMGSGTTAQVAQNLGRRWIGVELNADYIALQQARTAQQAFAL